MGLGISLSLLLSLATIVETSPKSFDVTQPTSNLSPYVEVYSESTNSDEWATDVPPSHLFSSIDSGVPNLGLSPGRHWFRVVVDNKLETQTFIVEAGYPLWTI